MKTLPIEDEINAVESRLNEIENEMSHEHRDHAFEYWWQLSGSQSAKNHTMRQETAREAFNRAHSIYCHDLKIISERPPVGGMYALYAMGVVSGIIVALVTFLLVVKPN